MSVKKIKRAEQYSEQEPNQRNKRDPDKNRTTVEQNPQCFLLCGKTTRMLQNKILKKNEKIRNNNLSAHIRMYKIILIFFCSRGKRLR